MTSSRVSLFMDQYMALPRIVSKRVLGCYFFTLAVPEILPWASRKVIVLPVAVLVPVILPLALR